MTVGRCAFALLVFVATFPCAFARSVNLDDTGAEIVITLAVELCPERGVTQQQMRDFVDRHRAEIEQLLNSNPRTFRTAPGGAAKRVRVRITYAYLETCDAERNPDRYRFKIGPRKPGQGTNASAGRAYLDNNARTFAHELAHALGLEDEYDYGPGGGTHRNLMGKSPHRALTDSHVMTMVFLHGGNPDAAEAACRRTIKALLRRYARDVARAKYLEGNCPPELFDRLVALLDANNATLQPLPPPPPAKKKK